MIRALAAIALLVALMLGPLPATTEEHATRQHAPCAVRRGYKETARFRRLTGYPTGRKGYVVDHIVPLCACGPDSVSNMQYQRADSGYAKDAWEREMCRALARDTLR